MPRQKPTKFWQTERFKNLRDIWEEKLEASGFQDVEYKGKLRQNSGNSYRTKVIAVIENKQRYYEILGQRHHDERFHDPVEKYVIERRSQGISCVQIRRELKERGQKNGRDTIRKILRHYECKWNIAKKKA